MKKLLILTMILISTSFAFGEVYLETTKLDTTMSKSYEEYAREFIVKLTNDQTTEVSTIIAELDKEFGDEYTVVGPAYSERGVLEISFSGRVSDSHSVIWVPIIATSKRSIKTHAFFEVEVRTHIDEQTPNRDILLTVKVDSKKLMKIKK